MGRQVHVDTAPRRGKCAICEAPIWRLYVGRGGSILLDREGTTPLRTTKGVAAHRCQRRKDP